MGALCFKDEKFQSVTRGTFGCRIDCLVNQGLKALSKFSKGGHGEARENCREHLFHIEIVNNIGCKQRSHSWAVEVSWVDQIIEQRWTEHVILISISDQTLDAILVDQVIMGLRWVAK